MAQLVIHGGEIKIHFAGEFRFKGFHFQINHDVAPQPEMIKQQVEVIILAAHFQMILPADKGESDAQFKQKSLDMFQQA